MWPSTRSGEDRARDHRDCRGLGARAAAPRRCNPAPARARARPSLHRRDATRRARPPLATDATRRTPAHTLVRHPPLCPIRCPRAVPLARRGTATRRAPSRSGSRPIRDAGFLADDEDVASGGERSQDRRGAEVEIRANLLRAVRIRARTPRHEHVVGGHLSRPADRSGRDVEREDRVGRPCRGLRVGIAGADVISRRFTSIVGDDQIDAPAGPQSCVPARGLLLGRARWRWRSSSRSPRPLRRRGP